MIIVGMNIKMSRERCQQIIREVKDATSDLVDNE